MLCKEIHPNKYPIFIFLKSFISLGEIVSIIRSIEKCIDIRQNSGEIFERNPAIFVCKNGG
ncbi:hypothetical protein D5282_03855 [bacterium 1xD8-48]|nr:hypothetical protein [bacterium 1xD8-48]